MYFVCFEGLVDFFLSDFTIVLLDVCFWSVSLSSLFWFLFSCFVICYQVFVISGILLLVSMLVIFCIMLFVWFASWPDCLVRGFRCSFCLRSICCWNSSHSPGVLHCCAFCAHGGSWFWGCFLWDSFVLVLGSVFLTFSHICCVVSWLFGSGGVSLRANHLAIFCGSCLSSCMSYLMRFPVSRVIFVVFISFRHMSICTTLCCLYCCMSPRPILLYFALVLHCFCISD